MRLSLYSASNVPKQNRNTPLQRVGTVGPENQPLESVLLETRLLDQPKVMKLGIKDLEMVYHSFIQQYIKLSQENPDLKFEGLEALEKKYVTSSPPELSETQNNQSTLGERKNVLGSVEIC